MCLTPHLPHKFHQIMHKIFTRKYGKIEMFKQLQSKTILVIPKGVIGLSLLKEYLRFIEKLDQEDEEKFNHIVDTSEVKFANPLNPLWLRKISKLKNLNLYIVIVPSNALRFFVKLMRWVNRPDHVFKSLSTAQAFLKDPSKITK